MVSFCEVEVFENGLNNYKIMRRSFNDCTLIYIYIYICLHDFAFDMDYLFDVVLW